MTPREEIINEVKRILHGPIYGPNEELENNPLDFYTTGILFPQIIAQEDTEDTSGDLLMSSNFSDEEHIDGNSQCGSDSTRLISDEEIRNSDDDFTLTTQFRPSASGISVLIYKTQKLTLNVEFAIYEKKYEKKTVNKYGHEIEYDVIRYKRIPVTKKFPLNINDNQVLCDHLKLENQSGVYTTTSEFNQTCQLKIVVRKYNQNSNKQILTATLINTNLVRNFKSQKDPSACIFQPYLSLNTSDSFLPFEDFSDLSELNKEDVNNKFQYRNYRSYGMGHGISVNWNFEGNIVRNVFSHVLPEKDVNGVETNPEIFRNSEILYMKYLAGHRIEVKYNWQSVKKQLEDFILFYDRWIETKKACIDSTWPNEFIIQANENLSKCKQLFHRMKRGVEILDTNELAKKAFEDANKAMFMQRVMSDFSNHRRNSNRVLSNDESLDDELPDFTAIPYDADSKTIWNRGKLTIPQVHENVSPLARWRPFQLAFILSQIEGLTNPESEDRNTVDLIWFPTGGGKTEAYLGLIALTTFYRRLNAKRLNKNPDFGAGVTVFMRYTLRLLNKQQFERANILICACELIRKQEPGNYGSVRIKNGIWMGRSMTPNDIGTQTSDYKHYINSIENKRKPDEYRTSPPILSCPCCGNRLIKEIEKNEIKGRWGYLRPRGPRNSVPAANIPYYVSCTNSKCEFHNSEINFDLTRTIPVIEVDELIYKERPTLLFSTVDKFVTLAWNDKAFKIFNLDTQNYEIIRLYPAPELIIQDELHLISSSLGTIYGVYEIAIDQLCKKPQGQLTKIIGATATVRNAEEQTRRLYARKNFMQFPPPALDADDSFYSVKKTEDINARKYIGFMPSGITTSTALIRLTSVLLERIPSLCEFTNSELDPYYTLIVYFNALKELGKFRTFLTDDIVAYRKVLCRQFNTFFKPYSHDRLCELSSVMNAEDITKGLDRLEKSCLKDLPKNEIIKFLNSISIRNLKDVEIGSDRKKFLTNKNFFQQLNIPYVEGDNDKSHKDNYQKLINKLKEIGFDEDKDPIQIAPATNMISVGVDIPRLNTMVINGQPKTTAEYIQASSRIGREKPGVVFTFLAPTKNRDRSHYEQFVDFHQAYYKFVESSSVTPFSRPALEKVLPTVMVTLCRSLFLKCNNPVFILEDRLKSFFKQVIDDVSLRASTTNSGVQFSIDFEKIFIRSFEKLQSTGARKFSNYSDFLLFNPESSPEPTIQNHHLVYNAPSQFVDVILSDHIPTLQSLRNVEPSTRVLIK